MKNDIKSAFGAFASDVYHDEIGLRDSGIERRAAKFKDFALFSTPGHKGALLRGDVTEYDEDNLFPAGAVSAAERDAAEFYGAAKLRFSVCGSSMPIKAAFLCVGGDVVAPQFTHRCAFEGARLAKSRLIVFSTDEKCGIPAVPLPEDYERAFAENPSAVAAFATSPDYFGRCADLRGIKSVCDKRGKLLIADCAHGAHFASRPDIFPEGGEKIADFAALSAHKTLRALTQSAFGVCNNSDYFAGYDAAMELIGTTSPSYLLLASLENAVEYEKRNSAGYDALIAECRAIKNEVKCLASDDPLRICVDAGSYGLTGKALYYALMEKNIMPETYFEGLCVFIVTLSDTAERVAALKAALKDILK